MRPRRVRLGWLFRRRPALDQGGGFNEAEARAPRMGPRPPWLRPARPTLQ